MARTSVESMLKTLNLMAYYDNFKIERVEDVETVRNLTIEEFQDIGVDDESAKRIQRWAFDEQNRQRDSERAAAVQAAPAAPAGTWAAAVVAGPRAAPAPAPARPGGDAGGAGDAPEKKSNRQLKREKEKLEKLERKELEQKDRKKDRKKEKEAAKKAEKRTASPAVTLGDLLPTPKAPAAKAPAAKAPAAPGRRVAGAAPKPGQSLTGAIVEIYEDLRRSDREALRSHARRFSCKLDDAPHVVVSLRDGPHRGRYLVPVGFDGALYANGAWAGSWRRDVRFDVVVSAPVAKEGQERGADATSAYDHGYGCNPRPLATWDGGKPKPDADYNREAQQFLSAQPRGRGRGKLGKGGRGAGAEGAAKGGGRGAAVEGAAKGGGRGAAVEGAAKGGGRGAGAVGAAAKGGRGAGPRAAARGGGKGGDASEWPTAADASVREAGDAPLRAVKWSGAKVPAAAAADGSDRYAFRSALARPEKRPKGTGLARPYEPLAAIVAPPALAAGRPAGGPHPRLALRLKLAEAGARRPDALAAALDDEELAWGDLARVFALEGVAGASAILEKVRGVSAGAVCCVTTLLASEARGGASAPPPRRSSPPPVDDDLPPLLDAT